MKKLDRVIVVNAVKVGMNEIYLTILLFFRYLLIDFRTLTKKSNMGKALATDCLIYSKGKYIEEGIYVTVAAT